MPRFQRSDSWGPDSPGALPQAVTFPRRWRLGSLPVGRLKQQPQRPQPKPQLSKVAS